MVWKISSNCLAHHQGKVRTRRAQLPRSRQVFRRDGVDTQNLLTINQTTPEGLLFCPLPSQYIKLLSDSNNKFRKVYALYRPNSKCNWIARRIVAYLRLTSHPHQPIREAVFEGNTIKSVGRFVELTCALQESLIARNTASTSPSIAPLICCLVRILHHRLGGLIASSLA